MLRKTAKFFAVSVAILVFAIGFKLTSKNISSPFFKEQIEQTHSKKTDNKLSNFDYGNIRFVSKNIQMKPNTICSNVADIIRRGELVVCALNHQNKFFQIKTKNGYVGEDIRFASALGKALGVKVIYKMVYKTYGDVVEAIHNGEGDVGIAELSYTTERARKVVYSEPYVNSRQLILINRIATVNKDGETLSKLLNTPEAKIAVMKNTSYENYAKMLFPKAQILSESEWENGVVKELREGKVVAIIWDEARIKPLINAHPDLLLRFLPIVLKGEKDPISAITSNKECSLHVFINKFLENEYKSLSVKEMLQLYEDYVK